MLTSCYIYKWAVCMRSVSSSGFPHKILKGRQHAYLCQPQKGNVILTKSGAHYITRVEQNADVALSASLTKQQEFRILHLKRIESKFLVSVFALSLSRIKAAQILLNSCLQS